MLHTLTQSLLMQLEEEEEEEEEEEIEGCVD